MRINAVSSQAGTGFQLKKNNNIKFGHFKDEEAKEMATKISPEYCPALITLEYNSNITVYKDGYALKGRLNEDSIQKTVKPKKLRKELLKHTENLQNYENLLALANTLVKFRDMEPYLRSDNRSSVMDQWLTDAMCSLYEG